MPDKNTADDILFILRMTGKKWHVFYGAQCTLTMFSLVQELEENGDSRGLRTSECPICKEVYADPRVLPWVHTYCLKCIETWNKDKRPGDEVACPLCRKEFTLSSNGVGQLPMNFFVANFLKELSSVDSKTRTLCEACIGDEASQCEVRNVASVYCIGCEMKICHICKRSHKAL